MKDKRLNIRLSNELYNMLQFKATAAKKSNSDFIRQSILKSEIRVDESKNQFFIISSINKLGNNINQIAYVLNCANKSNNLNAVDYSNILDELIIIEKQLKVLINDK